MRIKSAVGGVLIGIAACNAGCGILSGTQSPAPPIPPTSESQPTAAPQQTFSPTAEVTQAPSQSFISVVKGEILFISDDQVWAIRPDGSNRRALTSLPSGASISELAVSPNGQYAAYIINGTLAEVLELTSGTRTTVDFANKNRFDNIVWAADGSAVFYHKLVVDDQSKPVSSEIWKVSILPTSAAEQVFQSDLSNGPMTVPFAALDGGSLLLHQFGPRSGGVGDWITFDPAAQSSTPVADGFGVWNEQAGTQLMFSKEELIPGHLSVPIALYLAHGGEAPLTISPNDDDSAAYTQAKFGETTNEVSVIRYTQDAAGVISLGAALLQAGEGGVYQLTVLPLDPGAKDVAVEWSDGQHVIVQRLRGDSSEIWLLPADGSAGTLLTVGEQPQVVGN